MRTVSTTLLAAQRVSPQRPRVRVLVRDKQARLTLLGRQSVADVQSAACTAQNGTTIVIASLDTSGRIRVRLVTDPSSLDPTGDPGVGWGWYSTDYAQVVAAGGALAWPNGDICVSNNSGILRVFYINAAGTYILAVESTDNGVTWGAPVSVHVLGGGSDAWRVRLASAGHDDVFFTYAAPGYRYVNMGVYSGGSWGRWVGLQGLMETGGEYQNCYGLGAQWDGVLGKYAVIASLDGASNGDGRIVSCHFDGVTVSDYQGIVPPGIPMVGFVPWSPALLKTSDAVGPLWVVTYWDTFWGGATSWSSAMCIFSRDFSHWSYKVPLGFTVTALVAGLKRINLVELASVVYLHTINEAYQVDLWYAGKASHELTVPQGVILRYQVSERPEAGEVQLDLDNRGGTYDNPGISGYTAAALRPLAGVIVDQGLNTSAGDERVESRPFYVWTTAMVRESGVNLLRIYAVDGWKLLLMWEPDYAIQWVGKTLGWCIAELAARAGNWVVTTDGAAEWSQVLPVLTLVGMNGTAILRYLLALVGGVARFGNGDSREVLYCFIPSAQGVSPVAVHTYSDGEVLGVESVDGFAWPTRVRVTGSAGGYEAQSVGNALAAGMDFLQVGYARQWATAAQLQDAADGILDVAAARAWGGWLRCRPNVGLEIFDVVTFTDLKAGGGLTLVKRRVNGLVTEFDPLQKVWQQTVYLEGV